jgi:predicted MPP superfamily phosphohydrolase
MKLAWATDIHLNFLEAGERQNFYQDILGTQCDAVLITGDIAEAPSVTDLLKEMADQVNKPIYFVLGNHDYYRGRIDEVKAEITELTKTHDKLFWLPAAGIQTLAGDTLLVGQDGWADGRLGDYENSRVGLNDSRLIFDLFQEKIFGKSHLLKKMQQLADTDAKQLESNLEQAVAQKPKKVIVLTHVPPFREACCYNGEISNDDWLPYFSSKVMGDVLLKMAKENPAAEFLVLCGHTHGEATYQPLDNLMVEAGSAEYYYPQIQKIIHIG